MLRSKPNTSAASSAFPLALLALLLAGGTAAHAQSCLDQVRELGARYHVSTDPPTAPTRPTDKPVTSQDLARSGGVIEPPKTPDRSVISPPAKSPDRMPTVPDVTPRKKDESTAAGTLKAEDRATLQGLLVAARDQAEHGREEQCLEQLGKAKDLIGRSR